MTDSSESDSESEEESERVYPPLPSPLSHSFFCLLRISQTLPTTQDAKSKRVDFASVLPVELSLAIFRYFDEYDWTDLQSVCRNWATIINVLRNKQQRRLRRRPSRESSASRQAEKTTKKKKKSRIDPKTFHLARGMSTGALSLSSVKNKHHAGNSHSGGKLIDSLQDKKHGGAGSKMERMGKNFKSSALLTRKRRTKGGGGDDSSSSSSEDTDGDVDTPPAFAAPSKRERRRERRHHQDKDDSAYCSWSDDDDDECDMDNWEVQLLPRPKCGMLGSSRAFFFCFFHFFLFCLFCVPAADGAGGQPQADDLGRHPRGADAEVVPWRHRDRGRHLPHSELPPGRHSPHARTHARLTTDANRLIAGIAGNVFGALQHQRDASGRLHHHARGGRPIDRPHPHHPLR